MNIRELFTEYGITMAPEGHHHTRHGWCQIDCPACSPNSNRFRLGINEAHLYANCWTCGPVWLPKLLTQLIGPQAATGLERRFREQPKWTYKQQLILPKGLGDLLGPHIRYLESRGFNPGNLQKMWGIRGIGISSEHPWSLWIPVAHLGQIVSWLTRTLQDRGQRYSSAQPDQEVVPRGRTLYGADFARSGAIVVEGPLDAWAIGYGTVAICGLSYTMAQVRRIAEFPVRAICFDNEPEAQKRARKLADDLAAFPGSTSVAVLDAKDAGEASPREIRRLRKHFLRT